MIVIKNIKQTQTHFTDENTRVRILDDRERLLLIRKSYYEDLMTKLKELEHRKKDLIYNYREKVKELDTKIARLKQC